MHFRQSPISSFGAGEPSGVVDASGLDNAALVKTPLHDWAQRSDSGQEVNMS